MKLKFFKVLILKWLNKLFFSFILLIGFYHQASTQPTPSPFDLLAHRLDSLNKYGSPELIYIQTNKGIYETGEDLWFKAYILNSQFFTPSLLSETLYLQVTREDTNVPVWQEKYEIVDGFADGHMFLADTLSEGNYFLEAFTGHSFFDDNTEFSAIRKIEVKKDMKRRPSFTATFDKLFYEPADTLKATILALDENDKPLYAVIDASLFEGANSLGGVHSATDPKGEATFNFIAQGVSDNLRMEARIKYADKEEALSFPVPCKRGSTVQFNLFPEGGNIIAGIPCKMSFKAVDIDGNPQNINGTLFEDNIPLLEFSSFHAGMGSFNFLPDVDKKYSIRLIEPVTDSVFMLPEIYSDGFSLHLASRDNEYLNFIVSKKPGFGECEVYLRAQMQGQVYCMAAGKLTEKLLIKIPLDEMPRQGIAEFTLFNNNFHPVAERLVFVHPGKKLYIETELNKEKYETREKVTLKIKTRDEKGEPVPANLGVSVFDKFYQNPGDPINILTHCYLSSQLKGRIFNPAYYFDEKNENREEALDLLLLTQGWRKYIWNEENLESVKNKKQPVVFDWEEGEVKITRNQKKTQGVQQFIMDNNPNINSINELIISDSTDKFFVTPDHFKLWQDGYIYLKPLSPEEYKPVISLSSPFQKINEVLKTRNINYPLFNNSISSDKITERQFIIGPNVIELGEVTIKGKTTKPFRDKYMGHLDSLAKLDLCMDYVGKCGLINCPACISGEKPVEGRSYAKWVGKRNPGPHPYAYTGDEMETISEYHYPKLTEEELLKMNNLYKINAYYGKREFYQPDYDTETENDFIPDSRNTLLWAPSIITDKNGEATLEFFCSDINSGFTGKVEGVSGEGLLGTTDFEFKVLKTKSFSWEK